MNHAQAITDGETVLATIDIAVTPQRGFAALNSAEIETWWGAPGLYSIRNWRSDMRVGGRWSVDVHLPAGTVHPAGGEYLIVDEPRRVTLSRQYHWDHPTLGRQVTRVTYRFEPIDGGTRITVRQDEFGSPSARRYVSSRDWPSKPDMETCDELQVSGRLALRAGKVGGMAVTLAPDYAEVGSEFALELVTQPQSQLGIRQPRTDGT